jgi:hypothetical protein
MKIRFFVFLFLMFVLFSAVYPEIPQSTFFEGGNAGNWIIGVRYEWGITPSLSFSSSFGFSEFFHIGRPDTYGSAFLFDLGFEPRYYFSRNGRMDGAFAGLKLNGAVVNMPYYNLPEELGLDPYRINFAGGYAIRAGYKFSRLRFDIFEAQFRIVIEPAVSYHQIYYYDLVDGRFVSWFNVSVFFGIERASMRSKPKEKTLKPDVKAEPKEIIEKDDSKTDATISDTEKPLSEDT